MSNELKRFLAIDQGTTSSRSIIFDSDLNPITDSQKEYDLKYPEDGWVELNPDDIVNTVVHTLNNVIKKNDDIEACGITNQRETTIVWSRITGEPIYSGIVWQDRRTTEICSQLKLEGHEEKVKQKTGLVLDPYFSATKIQWILDNVEGARNKANKGELMFGTVDSYLIYKLTNEKKHLTDVTNASRTLLFNIHSMEWDEDLMNLFNIPMSMMPEVKDCDSEFGTLSISDTEIPIKGVIGDQQAALVGQNCFKDGDMKSTYGTGCFLMVNTNQNIISVDEGLLTTVAYKINNEVHYAIEGSIYSCGNIIKWLRDKMKFFENSEDSEDFLRKDGNSNNVLFLPAFNGLGAPYWNSEIRGSIHGIQRDSSKEDLITAVFKAICFQTLEIVEALKHDGVSVSALKVDGGMVKNKRFLQLLSNTLSINIKKPDQIESTAVGAFKIALLGSGIKDIDEIQKIGSYDEVKSQHSLKLNDDYLIWKEYLAKNL